MDAIVTAGGIPLPEEPLYAYTQGISKSMLDVAGKPMIQWVLDALGGSAKVDNIIIIGLDESSKLTCSKPLHFYPNQGRMLSNVVMGVEKSLALNPKNQHVMLVSSDIPGIQSEMVDWFVEAVEKDLGDFHYGVVPRLVMEARYPNSKRTFSRLKDMELCGADMSIIHVSMATTHLNIWERLIGNRKSPFRQAATIGFGTLFLLLIRQIGLASLVKRVSKSIGIDGRVIIWEHAEPGMDVDKPHQLEIMRADLAKP